MHKKLSRTCCLHQVCCTCSMGGSPFLPNPIQPHPLSSLIMVPGRVAQSLGHLTRKSKAWVRNPVWQHTFVFPSAFSRRAVVSYWRKYVHEVLVNRLGGLSLSRKSVVRLTDRPDMTLDVYRDVKQQYNQPKPLS